MYVSSATESASAEQMTGNAGVKIYANYEINSIPYLEDDESRWYIFLARKGVFSYPVKGKTELCGRGLMVLPSPMGVKGLRLGKEFKGYALSIPSTLAMSMDIPDDMRFYSLVRENPYVPLPDCELNTLNKYMFIINENLSGSVSFYSNMELSCLCQALVVTCRKYYNVSEHISRSTRTEKITNDFIRLVIRKCGEERQLDYYADELGITPKYLSSVISQSTGKHALKWIEEYTILSAKKLLKNTNLSVQDISVRLHFLSASDFCRYFRRNTGMTPNTYRLDQ